MENRCALNLWDEISGDLLPASSADSHDLPALRRREGRPGHDEEACAQALSLGEKRRATEKEARWRDKAQPALKAQAAARIASRVVWSIYVV